MPVEVIVFILRIIAAAAMLLFVIVTMWVMSKESRELEKSLSHGPKRYGTLTVVESGNELLEVGYEFAVHSACTIGRIESNSIVIPDDFASAEHALIALRHGQLMIEDLSSRNGTYVNGNRIESNVVIKTGDLITVGNVVMRMSVQ
ncbi:MAG: FHA domain-containing protein [Chloroflexota bacterium]